MRCFVFFVGLFLYWVFHMKLYRRHLARNIIHLPLSSITFDVLIQFNTSNLFAWLVVYSTFFLGGCFMFLVTFTQTAHLLRLIVATIFYITYILSTSSQQHLNIFIPFMLPLLSGRFKSPLWDCSKLRQCAAGRREADRCGSHSPGALKKDVIQLYMQTNLKSD